MAKQLFFLLVGMILSVSAIRLILLLMELQEGSISEELRDVGVVLTALLIIFGLGKLAVGLLRMYDRLLGRSVQTQKDSTTTCERQNDEGASDGIEQSQ